MLKEKITLLDVYKARKNIAPIIWKTPLVESPELGARSNATVLLKLESQQRTGSFKLRGATNKMLGLSAEELSRGVVAVSSGNHGRAVALGAKRLGIRAVICLSERVPKIKVEAIKRLGGEVVVHGDCYDAAEQRALKIEQEQGLTPVPSFDDPLVIAGQGTVGLEILEDWPEIDTAIVPLAGGSIFNGVALALKSADPSIRMVGVTMDRAPVMYQSLKAGKPIEMEETPTLADALAGGIGGEHNRYTFELTKHFIDEYVLVSEEEIAAAMVFALKEHKIAIEGAGAVGIAAVLHEKVQDLGKNVAVVVTGSNVDMRLLIDIAQGRLPYP